VLVVLLAGLLMTLASVAFAAGPKKDNDTNVQLLAINDFHGNLQPPTGSSGRLSVGPGGATVDAGGVDALGLDVTGVGNHELATKTSTSCCE
jgi:5'-nucleotidase